MCMMAMPASSNNPTHRSDLDLWSRSPSRPAMLEDNDALGLS